MNARRALVVAALPTLLAVGVASPALAKGGGPGVRASGPCATGTWKMTAKVDDGVVAVEAEIDTNRVGQTWSWRLTDNGKTFATGSSKTTAPSGSFTVRRTTANLPGTDTLRLTAAKGATVCHGVVALS
jgi:hypothetical protein